MPSGLSHIKHLRSRQERPWGGEFFKGQSKLKKQLWPKTFQKVLLVCFSSTGPDGRWRWWCERTSIRRRPAPFGQRECSQTSIATSSIRTAGASCNFTAGMFNINSRDQVFFDCELKWIFSPTRAHFEVDSAKFRTPSLGNSADFSSHSTEFLPSSGKFNSSSLLSGRVV